jgi:hypothetical protein
MLQAASQLLWKLDTFRWDVSCGSSDPSFERLPYYASVPHHSLLQNSNLISRYATLRAAALKLPAAAQLYGGDLLSLEEQQGESGSNDAVVVGRGGQYQAIADLELRLSGTLGVEVSCCCHQEPVCVQPEGALHTSRPDVGD